MYRLQVKWLFLLLFFGDGLFCVTGKSNGLAKKILRDPFNLPLKSLAKSSTKERRENRINLLGIVHSAVEYGAVLELDGKVETVFLNDDFYGFKILAIKTTSVELSRGKIKKKLFIE